MARNNNDQRGFASMDEDKQRKIASMGGKAAHEKGAAHEFDSQEAREAGEKGGDETARRHGPQFYSEIGEKGGKKVSQDRQHMRDIGRKGGESRGNKDDE